MVKIKRIYDEAAESDGRRVLVDRIWPRGISKEDADLDDWMKELAPSDGLRKWFGHQQEKWPGFVERYKEELREPAKERKLQKIAGWAEQGTVTLLFGARDVQHNQARVLQDLLAEEYGCKTDG